MINVKTKDKCLREEGSKLSTSNQLFMIFHAGERRRKQVYDEVHELAELLQLLLLPTFAHWPYYWHKDQPKLKCTKNATVNSKCVCHLGYASASFLENLLISKWFNSASGPRSGYWPSRHGVNDEGLRRRSFSQCFSRSRSLNHHQQQPAVAAALQYTRVIEQQRIHTELQNAGTKQGSHAEI